MKACFVFIIVLSVASMPSKANAGFFSDLVTKVLGNNIQASEIESIDSKVNTHNSQTVPLLEASVNPDVKNIKDEPELMIVGDDALSANTGSYGTDSISKQYATSAEITTYTVKKGDTLEKIAKKFGVSKNTIVSSNDSVNNAKSPLSVGQVLTILPIDGVAYTVKKGDTVTGLAKRYNATSKDILEYNDLTKASDLQIGDTIVIPGGDAPKIVEKEKTPIKVADKKPSIASKESSVNEEERAVSVEIEIPSSNESPVVASSGFIWPVSAGVGRISQGLHDDNAVDLAAPKGTPIYAPKSGTVLIADGSGWNGGYGLYVVINFNGGGQMLLGHMSKVTAVAGEQVNQGDLIGYVGSTGKSTGNHIHLSSRGSKNPYGSLRVNNSSSDFN